MSKPEDNNKRVIDLLAEIRDTIAIGNSHAAETAVNTRSTAKDTHRAAAQLITIKRDLHGIRIGDTGPDARLRNDPLTPAERRQVDEVKRRYRDKKRDNPHLSLLSVSNAVFRDASAGGDRTGYKNAKALNARASKELHREDNGERPF